MIDHTTYKCPHCNNTENLCLDSESVRISEFYKTVHIAAHCTICKHSFWVIYEFVKTKLMVEA